MNLAEKILKFTYTNLNGKLTNQLNSFIESSVTLHALNCGSDPPSNLRPTFIAHPPISNDSRSECQTAINANQWLSQEKISRGFKVSAGLEGGPADAAPPGRRRICEMFEKIFLRKWQKTHYFSLFSKKSKLSVKFLRVGRKTQLVWKIFEKNLKILDENSIDKLNFYLFLGKLLL